MPGGRSAVLAGAAVGLSYLLARSGADGGLDRSVTARLARARGPATDRLVGAVTDVGSVYGAAGTAVALALSGRRRLAAEVAAATGLAWVAAQAAKPLLPRRRPYELGTATRLVAPPAGSSWPSGHAAVAAATATTVVPGTSAATRAALAAAVAGVGASRCYVGVHHLSDVTAGVGVGVLAARVVRSGLRAARR